MTQEETILTFPKGLGALPGLHAFRLLEPPGSYPMKFLQAVEHPERTLTVMDVAAFKPDFEVALTEAEAAALALEQQGDALVLAVLAIPETPRETTANLVEPLVVNIRSRVGLQAHLDPNLNPRDFPVFGPRAEVLIHLQSGLLGFPEYRKLRLHSPSDSHPLKFLQVLDRPEVGFTCIETSSFLPEYQPPIPEADLTALGLEGPQEALVMALVVVPEDPLKMTANLAGPLVINPRTLEGRQLVLSTDSFPIRHRIIPEG